MFMKRKFSPSNPRGFVYFIAPESVLNRPSWDEGRRVKIGFTAGEPEKRLRALQTGCHVPLEICGCVRGTQALEAALHEAFAPMAVHREWFYAELKLGDLLGYFDGWCLDQNLIEEGQFEIALADNVFSDASPHPSVPQEEWVRSANPQALAHFFPDLWLEYQSSKMGVQP